MAGERIPVVDATTSEVGAAEFDVAVGVVQSGEHPAGRDSDDGGADSLLGLLKKTDKTFEIMEHQRFRAVNSSGYMVDLIRQTPKPPWRSEPNQIGGADDFLATDLTHMDWMLSAPKLTQTVLAQDGRAFEMTVPDPRSYMLFKGWLSQQMERDPLKKGRDASQAKIVHQLLVEYLPQYPLDWTQFKSFPQGLTDKISYQV